MWQQQWEKPIQSIFKKGDLIKVKLKLQAPKQAQHSHTHTK